jgi:hypothetical protein
VSVALGGADLGVAEQAPDHFKRGAARNQQGGEGVAQIVDADVGDFLLLTWREERRKPPLGSAFKRLFAL